jgi:hypothetical protein
MPQERQHGRRPCGDSNPSKRARQVSPRVSPVLFFPALDPFGRSGDLLELAHRPCKNADDNEGQEDLPKWQRHTRSESTIIAQIWFAK